MILNLLLSQMPHMKIYQMAHLVLEDVILLVGRNNNANTLSWSSNKIKCVAKSTTAAEALSLVNGLEEAIYL